MIFKNSDGTIELEERNGKFEFLHLTLLRNVPSILCTGLSPSKDGKGLMGDSVYLFNWTDKSSLSNLCLIAEDFFESYDRIAVIKGEYVGNYLVSKNDGETEGYVLVKDVIHSNNITCVLECNEISFYSEIVDNLYQEQISYIMKTYPNLYKDRIKGQYPISLILQRIIDNQDLNSLTEDEIRSAYEKVDNSPYFNSMKSMPHLELLYKRSNSMISPNIFETDKKVT